MKKIMLFTVGTIVFFPCVLCVSEDISTIIIGVVYTAALSTIIRKTKQGRKFLVDLYRETLRLEREMELSVR